jgi:hypothetical protein
MTVAEVACQNSQGIHRRYKIAGHYSVDKALKSMEKRLPPGVDTRGLSELISAFRKSYMLDKEWIVIIGGSKGTKEETEEAQKLGATRIFPVPCMGGYGRELWEKESSSGLGGLLKICGKCVYNDLCAARCASCGSSNLIECPNIEQIADILCKPRDSAQSNNNS